MTTEIHRRLAAWLLMLPDPVSAPSRDAALSEARRRFDRLLPLDAFEAALCDLGYSVRQERGDRYVIAPIEALDEAA